MQSGIEIAENCREEFNKMRLKRQYRYVIYKPNEDNSNVEVEHCGEREENFEQFKEKMAPNQSR